MVTKIEKKSWFRRHWILTIIIFLFTFFFIIGIIGAIISPNSQQKSNRTQEKQTETAQSTEEQSLPEKITKAVSSYQCSIMTKLINQTECYANLAIQKSDISLCKNIGDGNDVRYEEFYTLSFMYDDYKEELKDFCRFKYAKGKNDGKLCDLIIGVGEARFDKIACYIYFANKTGDDSYCGKIPIEYFDIASLQKFQTYIHRNVCYWLLAQTYNDKSFCEKIERVDNGEPVIGLGNKERCIKGEEVSLVLYPL